jgi:phosphoribosyl 1,2-cyclic phosphate phosphodiesterase
MRVTLLGTGDTTGTPTVGCDCDTCAAARERGVERSRFSVHVANERTGECLLVDASPDFRRQFRREDVALPDAAVVTHIHFDHLDGLGNAYRLLGDFDVYAADRTDPETGESVAESVADRYDYLSRLSVTGASPGDPVDVCGFEVTLVPVAHPPLHSYGVRIEGGGATLALTGDTRFSFPEPSRDALRGADLLFADAIVPASVCETHPAGGMDYHDGVPYTFSNKHMTREGAAALAAELGADRARLVHCSHYYGADEAFADPLAVDGETYDL